ncbi:hypothetical protein [Sedimenticola sp.]|uniref:hypothetical protein n=1 Tax=Sedimenticola sp. TaxID=1940285 RepID=UPI003D1094E1
MTHSKRIGPFHFTTATSVLAAVLVTVSLSAQADGGSTYSGYDINRDGYLDPVEFEQFAAPKRARSTTPEIWHFQHVNRDQDNRISEKEMVDALIEEVKLKQRNQ